MLSHGPIPEHIAIVMDGNRRYASRKGLAPLSGHSEGFSKLREVLEWCSVLCVPVVSVFAFSLDNFNRSSEEVDGLFTLAETKLRELLEADDLLEKHDIRVQIVGNLTMLPTDLCETMEEVMQKTRHRKTLLLNICFAYSATHELASTSCNIVEGLRSGHVSKSDITPRMIEKCLPTGNPLPDIMLRTSGETRLSDFMLCQSEWAQLHFVEALWPDLSLCQFLLVILTFQRDYSSALKTRPELPVCSEKANLFIQSLK